jgi:hypothetical protein
LYVAQHSGFPLHAERRVAVTLFPPNALLDYFPGYVAKFSADSSDVLKETVTYEVRPLRNSNRKAIDISVVASLVGWPAGKPVRATWSFGSLLSGRIDSVRMEDPLNKEFKVTRTYAPSLNQMEYEWQMGVTVSDNPNAAVPNAAATHSASRFTFGNKERRYYLTPSHLIVEADGPTICQDTIVLRAVPKLLSGIGLATAITWRTGRDLVSNVGRKVTSPTNPHIAQQQREGPFGKPYVFRVDPRDSTRAYVVLNDASSVVVEAAAETDLGEKMVTRVEMVDYCRFMQTIDIANPAELVPAEKRLVDIWKGTLALQMMSRTSDTTLRSNVRLRAAAIGSLEQPLDEERWGARLSAAQREERDAFVALVRGTTLSANAKKALGRLAARGRAVRIEAPADAQVDKTLHRLLVRTISIGANGRNVRRP